MFNPAYKFKFNTKLATHFSNSTEILSISTQITQITQTEQIKMNCSSLPDFGRIRKSHNNKALYENETSSMILPCNCKTNNSLDDKC